MEGKYSRLSIGRHSLHESTREHQTLRWFFRYLPHLDNLAGGFFFLTGILLSLVIVCFALSHNTHMAVAQRWSFWTHTAKGAWAFLAISWMFIVFICWLFVVCLVEGQSASWIEEQYNASLRMMLDNVFKNGTVIASPSRREPDYYVPETYCLMSLIIVPRSNLSSETHVSGFVMRLWWWAT